MQPSGPRPGTTVCPAVPMGHPLLGTWLPDMQDLGFSEDTVMYRGYYGFKLALPLYPFITMYQFMQVMQSPARAKMTEIALIRGGMRVGLLSWLPIAVGSAAFYGLEFGLRPAMHSVLGMEPIVTSPAVTAEQREGAPAPALLQEPLEVDAPWTDGQLHTAPPSGLDGIDMSSLGSAVPAPGTAAGEAPAKYYPPLVGTQIAAGTLAASAVAVNMLRGGGAGGLGRFALYCLMGGVAGAMVPSYEDAMARKYS